MAKKAIATIAKTIKTNSRIEIQMGDNTHTHDHEIYPVSFRTIKATVKSPEKPIPAELEEEDDFMRYPFCLSAVISRSSPAGSPVKESPPISGKGFALPCEPKRSFEHASRQYGYGLGQSWSLGHHARLQLTEKATTKLVVIKNHVQCCLDNQSSGGFSPNCLTRRTLSLVQFEALRFVKIH